MPLTETPLQRLVNSSLGLHARYMAGVQRHKAYRRLEVQEQITPPALRELFGLPPAYPDEQPSMWYPLALSTDLAGDETSPPR